MSSVKMQMLGNKKAAGGTVQVSLENTDFEGSSGVKLRRAVPLTHRWQTEDKAKLWRGVCSPRDGVGDERLGTNPKDHLSEWLGRSAGEATQGLRRVVHGGQGGELASRRKRRQSTDSSVNGRGGRTSASGSHREEGEGSGDTW